jgi:hypothetical protein
MRTIPPNEGEIRLDAEVALWKATDVSSSAAPSDPRVPGLEPTFRHLDDPDVTWQQVRRQRNADGSEASVWEKWLAFSPDPQYLSLYARYDPGMIVRRHGHFSPHLVFVIEGGAWFGDRWCPAGTHIELPLGAAFGPVRAGDDGAVMFEVMMGDPRSWGDEPERFDATLAEHGATRLPDVELDYPDWLTDLRKHWVTPDPEPTDHLPSDPEPDQPPRGAT